eukprot:COSAG02_NODE_7376_length_3043_cov_1.606318_1_plen_275_part_10
MGDNSGVPYQTRRRTTKQNHDYMGTSVASNHIADGKRFDPAEEETRQRAAQLVQQGIQQGMQQRVDRGTTGTVTSRHVRTFGWPRDRSDPLVGEIVEYVDRQNDAYRCKITVVHKAARKVDLSYEHPPTEGVEGLRGIGFDRLIALEPAAVKPVQAFTGKGHVTSTAQRSRAEANQEQRRQMMAARAEALLQNAPAVHLGPRERAEARLAEVGQRKPATMKLPRLLTTASSNGPSATKASARGDAKRPASVAAAAPAAAPVEEQNGDTQCCCIPV